MIDLIWKRNSLNGLTKVSSTSTKGRQGRILTRHKSNPNFKRKFRALNLRPFLLEKETAQVMRIERDPNRSAFIGLCRLLRSGFLSYFPVSNNTKPGDYIYINPTLSQIENNGLISTSNRKFNTISPLYALPKGVLINNITSSPFGEMTLCRSAGSKAKLLSFSSDKRLASLLMPSGKIVYLSTSCYAFSGVVSNPNHFLNKKVKAGQNRWLGIRPTVRGVAMNPVDHPHGGGEGKSSGGRPSVSPWGKLTKGGYKTISNSKKDHGFKIKKLFNKI